MEEVMSVIQKPKHGSMEWLRLRWRDEEGRCVIGASEAASLMNASVYGNRADLFFTKSVEPRVSEETPAFRKGNLLEPVLIAEASHLLGTDIFTPEVMYRRGRFTVTLDGVDNQDAPSIVIEAKTNSRQRVKTADDLPPEYLWQGWAQQYVTGAEVKFIVLDVDQSISLIDLPRNPEALAALAEEAEAFCSMIDCGAEPPADLISQWTAKEIAAFYRPVEGETELSEEAIRWLMTLEEMRHSIKEYENMKAEAEAVIARELRGQQVGTFRGNKVVTWKEQAGRMSVNQKALKEEMPEVWEKYQQQGASFRVLRITGKFGE